MGEFDLSLISEFRCRPAFYDRNSPNFKDKVFTAHLWQEISNKLGYDVSLLKDRMLQLRNRYNLEKRRLEQLREENPGRQVESPWPLYHQLHFLSEHIRARRSYKRSQPAQTAEAAVPMTCIPATTNSELSNSESNRSSTGPPACHAAAPFANGMLTVKMEEEDDGNEDNDSDAESESQSGTDNGNYPSNYSATINDATTLPQHSSGIASAQQIPQGFPPSITIRRLDTMRSTVPTQIAQKRRAILLSNKTKPQKNATPLQDAKRVCLSTREQKYAAFGSFISSSLLELPAKKALQLVEKFTSDLVHMLIQKTEAGAEDPDVNGDLNGE